MNTNDKQYTHNVHILNMCSMCTVYIQSTNVCMHTKFYKKITNNCMYTKWPKLAFCMHTKVLLYYANNLITVCKKNAYKLHAHFGKGLHMLSISFTLGAANWDAGGTSLSIFP